MYNVVAVLPKHLADGLSLSGLSVIHAETAPETESAVREVIESGEYGIVVVAEEIMEKIDERTAERFHEQTVPLLISIPSDIRWRDIEEKRTDEYAAALIRRAIGYQLNIQL